MERVIESGQLAHALAEWRIFFVVVVVDFWGEEGAVITIILIIIIIIIIIEGLDRMRLTMAIQKYLNDIIIIIINRKL